MCFRFALRVRMCWSISSEWLEGIKLGTLCGLKTNSGTRSTNDDNLHLTCRPFERVAT